MNARSLLASRLNQVDDWVSTGTVNGVSLAVRTGGEEAAIHVAGYASPDLLVSPDTLFGLASVSKPITAALVMALVDDGMLSLEEPVVRFVPEFANPAPDGNSAWEAARRLVTVRQALAHLTGLPEDLAPGTLRSRDLPSLDTITDHLIARPLQFEPGSELRYSNAGYALLGRLIQRVAGEDIWTFARHRLLDPMGLNGIVARPRESDEAIALVADAGSSGTEHEAYNSPYWRNLAIPWGGLYGTSRDIARFAEQFAHPTNLPLSKRGRELMIADQADGVAGGLTSLKVVWKPAHWGLGWEVKGSKRRHWTGDYTSPQTWCHWGAAGTLVWCDPVADVTLAVFANRMTLSQWPFQPVARWSRLSNAIIAVLGGR